MEKKLIMKISTLPLKQTALIVFAALSLMIYSAQSKAVGQTKDQLVQGKKTYLSYCASCHGPDGSGNGPVASALKQRPSDLRHIQSIGGKFPEAEVQRKIAGEFNVPVHGQRDMPVWGMILKREEMKNLVKYLESIQRPVEPQPAD